MIGRKWTCLGASLGYFFILILFFAPSLRESKISSQADHLYQFYPWKSLASKDIVDQNHLLADQSLQYLPWYKHISDSVRQFQVPLWNAYSLGGTPLVANLGSAFFYPLNWIYFVFSSDEFLVWLGIIKLFLGGVFTFLFLRCIHLSVLSSFLGGLIFMLSGFNVLWLFHPHTNVSIFLPCLLYLTERMLNSQKNLHYLLLSLVIGIQFLGGHLETSFYILFAASLYFLIRLFQIKELQHHRTRTFSKYILAMVLGVGLASCQLLPFFEYLFESSMLYQRSLYVHAQGGVFSLSRFKVLVTLLWPNFYGSPLTHNYSGPLNYNEINGAYIGILSLVLAIGSLFIKNKNGIHKFFIFFGMFAMGMIYQLPILYPLVKSLPGFSMTNTTRMLLFLGFSNMVLCAYALHHLLIRCKKISVRIALWGILLLLIGFDLFYFGQGYNPIVDQGIIYPETETTRLLQQENKGPFRIATPLSVFPHETHLPYKIPSIRGYDALEIRTYTEFMNLVSDHKHAAYFVFATPHHNKIDSPLFDLLNVKYFITPLDQELNRDRFPLVYSGEVNMYLNKSYLPRAFLISNYIVEKDKKKRLALLSHASFSPAKTLVLEEEISYESRDIAGSAVKITDYQSNRVKIHVQAAQECFLVLTDNFFPGWKAYVDDQSTPIYRAYHTFRAVRVPQGESIIEFKYRPWSFYSGVVLSIVALGMTLLLFTSRE